MSAVVEPVRIEAHAKVNLYLHVVGRRSDGYHLLDSLVAFVAIGDTLEVEAAEGLSLTIDGPFAAGLATDGGNLVIRAAEALAAAAAIPARAAIRLTKRLPVASGIGGGSADAAAALRALIRLWRPPLAAERLAAIALSLGADVPMCLDGRNAFVGGVGEAIEPCPPLPRCWLVLANPGVAVPTPAVYKARSGPFSAPARWSDAPADAAALADLLAGRGNDLTAAAVALAPSIGAVLAALEGLPGALVVRMSGSGGSCFALFADEAAARSGASRLGEAQPGWWVAAAPVVDTHANSLFAPAAGPVAATSASD